LELVGWDASEIGRARLENFPSLSAAALCAPSLALFVSSAHGTRSLLHWAGPAGTPLLIL
jgi:hypothetical protein